MIDVLDTALPDALRVLHEQGYELWAASRPMFGTVQPKLGHFAGVTTFAEVPGAPRLWAAIDPKDTYAEIWRKRNVELDGVQVMPRSLDYFRQKFEGELRERNIPMIEIEEIWGSWYEAARTMNYPLPQR